MDITIPQIGESIQTVFIARWIKQAGQPVAEGEAIVELDSDKASLEVPAPCSGVLGEHLAAEGDEVAIGTVVGRIAKGEAPSPVSTADAPASDAPASDAPASDAPAEAAVRAGPAARKEAHASGVDLHAVTGTGPRGRVTTHDVRGPSVGETRVKMTPLRRTIARRLVESQQSTATLTTFNEVDLSRVMALRSTYKESFEKKHGVKLGFMSFFAKATIEALREFPAVNAEIDGDEIVYKPHYNLGIAVSGPKGLVVPVLRNADRLSFAETEVAIGELAGRARDNKLSVADFDGGTFTISNGGVFGSLLSTPILNPPQVGILGMHTIQQRPVGVEGRIELRPMMYLALSYDHRIIDGREAVSFLCRIKDCVEAPDRILLDV